MSASEWRRVQIDDQIHQQMIQMVEKMTIHRCYIMSQNSMSKEMIREKIAP